MIAVGNGMRPKGLNSGGGRSQDSIGSLQGHVRYCSLSCGTASALVRGLGAGLCLLANYCIPLCKLGPRLHRKRKATRVERLGVGEGFSLLRREKANTVSNSDRLDAELRCRVRTILGKR